MPTHADRPTANVPAPPPFSYREHDGDAPTAMGFALIVVGFGADEEADIRRRFDEAGLLDPAGPALAVERPDPLEEPSACRLPSDLERGVLGRSRESYLLEVRPDSRFVLAPTYPGVVHAVERLVSWRRDPARRCFTLLDFPVLEVRGFNRDDAEDWSSEWWRRTIDHCRSQFVNLIGFAAENAFMHFVRGETEEYQRCLETFAEVREMGRRSGIRIVPMVYNCDHFTAVFLRAYGRQDLTRMRGRTVLRYDVDEAWDLAVDIFSRVFVDLGAETFCLWASEVIHERHGDRDLREEVQWQKEADFFARLLERVRVEAPTMTFLACTAQGTRDHIRVFTQRLADLPVEFVHYDGDWCYQIDPPEQTTYGVRRSLEAGAPWIAKPPWIRVFWQGLPVLRLENIYAEGQELVRYGYTGVFANGTRWETIPWNLHMGAVTAWGGDRLTLDEVITDVLAREGETQFSPHDVVELERVWRRVMLFNNPFDGGARISPVNSIMYDLVMLVDRASTDHEFVMSDLEEAYLDDLWDRNAAWFRDAMRLVASWEDRLPLAPEPRGTIWDTALRVLPAMLRLYSHALAAAHVVAREYGLYNTKGPWRAWRPLLQFHLEGVVAGVDEVLSYIPLDGIRDKDCSDLFETSSDTATPHGRYTRREWSEPLRLLQATSEKALTLVGQEDSFPAVRAAIGIHGYWPREGLYSVVEWPLRFGGEIFAS